MKANEAIREILKSQGMSQADLSKELGITPAGVWERLNCENISVPKFNEMLEVLGYVMVIQPNDSKLAAGAVEIK